MMRTSVNIVGDASAAVVVAGTEKAETATLEQAK